MGLEGIEDSTHRRRCDWSQWDSKHELSAGGPVDLLNKLAGENVYPNLKMKVEGIDERKEKEGKKLAEG